MGRQNLIERVSERKQGLFFLSMSYFSVTRCKRHTPKEKKTELTELQSPCPRLFSYVLLFLANSLNLGPLHLKDERFLQLSFASLFASHPFSVTFNRLIEDPKDRNLGATSGDTTARFSFFFSY